MLRMPRTAQVESYEIIVECIESMQSGSCPVTLHDYQADRNKSRGARGPIKEHMKDRKL